MSNFEKLRFVQYPKEDDILMFLPNYDKNKKRKKDFIDVFYFRFNDKIVFDDIDNPIPEDLKLDLFQEGLLGKMTLCYTLYFNEKGKAYQRISILSYNIIKKLSEDLQYYYDIEEYPKVKIIKKDKDSENDGYINGIVSYEKWIENDISEMKNEDFFKILYKRPFTIEEKLKYFSWINYEKELKKLFIENKRLNKYRNVFRIQRIKSVLNEL